MSKEDRKKHIKSADEIREELIAILVKSGASKETIEEVRNAKNSADLLRIWSLIHDAGHPYMGPTHEAL